MQAAGQYRAHTYVYCKYKYWSNEKVAFACGTVCKDVLQYLQKLYNMYSSYSRDVTH